MTFRRLCNTQRCTTACGAEYRVDGFAECLGPIEHDQDPGLDVQSPVDQISEDSFHDGGVFGVAVGETDGDLRAVRRDGHGHDQDLVSEMDTVDHQHGHIQPGEVTGE